jgi:hypothetical protein
VRRSRLATQTFVAVLERRQILFSASYQYSYVGGKFEHIDRGLFFVKVAYTR